MGALVRHGTRLLLLGVALLSLLGTASSLSTAPPAECLGLQLTTLLELQLKGLGGRNKGAQVVLFGEQQLAEPILIPRGKCLYVQGGSADATADVLSGAAGIFQVNGHLMLENVGLAGAAGVPAVVVGRGGAVVFQAVNVFDNIAQESGVSKMLGQRAEHVAAGIQLCMLTHGAHRLFALTPPVCLLCRSTSAASFTMTVLLRCRRSPGGGRYRRDHRLVLYQQRGRLVGGHL
jgi:hypothetical protein